MRPLILLSLLWASAAPAASPIAEILCEPTERLHRTLASRFGASRAGSGLRDREQVIELWTTPSGDWTLIATYATGTSCIVAMGETWSQDDPQGPS